MKYPKTLYVQMLTESNGETYPMAQINAEDLDDGSVAVYELKKVVKKTTKVELKG